MARFNEKLAKVMELAEKRALERKESLMDTDHLIWALFAYTDGPFYRWLEKRGIEPKSARSQVEKVLDNLYSQLSSVEESYRSAILQMKNELRSRYPVDFVDDVIKALLLQVDESIYRALKGEGEKEKVPVKVKRWAPVRETRSIFEEFFGEDFFSDIFERFFSDFERPSVRWSLREEVIEAPKSFVDYVREAGARYKVPQEDVEEVIVYLADAGEKISNSLLQLATSGVDPRRVVREILRLVFNERFEKVGYSYFVEQIIGKASEGKEEIGVADVVDAMLAYPKTVGGNILSQITKTIKKEGKKMGIREEMAEEEEES